MSFVFQCGIICYCVFRLGAWGKIKTAKTGKKSDSDLKTSSAGKRITPPLKQQKAQKPCNHKVSESLTCKKTSPSLYQKLGDVLAEKPGFEPGPRLSHATPLAGEPLRPLGYFSKPNMIFGKSGGERGIRTPGAIKHHQFSRLAP